MMEVTFSMTEPANACSYKTKKWLVHIGITWVKHSSLQRQGSVEVLTENSL